MRNFFRPAEQAQESWGVELTVGAVHIPAFFRETGSLLGLYLTIIMFNPYWAFIKRKL